jgi:hypothetical protein
MYNSVVVSGNINVNMLMREEMGTIWARDFDLGPGWLLYIREFGLEWQKTYTGLKDY